MMKNTLTIFSIKKFSSEFPYLQKDYMFGMRIFHGARLFSTSNKTSLYDIHLKYGGKMVDFAGWSLPVQYENFGIIESCLHTRSKASLFDVSHMGQLHIYGNDREKFIESLTVGDMSSLNVGESRLSVFTNADGGIVDDTVITKRSEFIQVVLNAGCVDKDMVHIETARAEFKGDVSLRLMRQFSLIALQGPLAAHVLQPHLGKADLTQLPFMSAIDDEVAGVPGCCVSRSGYTGEDGFEISIPDDESANHVVQTLLSDNKVKLAGLGARDTLRLEAGLCLYGTDINESISPIEAGLSWTISKRRREARDFPGAHVILDQMRNGVGKKRVGLTLLGGPPARHDNKLFVESDPSYQVGLTTSGTYSPSLGKSIALGYVDATNAAAGSPILVEVRGKVYPAIVTKMPFVKSNYYRINP